LGDVNLEQLLAETRSAALPGQRLLDSDYTRSRKGKFVSAGLSESFFRKRGLSEEFCKGLIWVITRVCISITITVLI